VLWIRIWDLDLDAGKQNALEKDNDSKKIHLLKPGVF
jgi:hypothetical protein